jgi:hypothetical protein
MHMRRRRGKTTILVAWAIANNSFILVADYRERERLIKTYKNAGLRPEQVITPLDTRRGKHHGAAVTYEVAIDNLELVISQLVGMPVNLISTSTEPVEMDPYEVVNLDDMLAREREAVKLREQAKRLAESTPVKPDILDFLKAAGGVNADPQLLADTLEPNAWEEDRRDR